MPLLRRRFAVFSSALVFSCGSADDKGDGTAQRTLPTDPGPATCGAGTMPAASDGSCRAVGPRVAPEGFAAVESGWGFRPVLPDGACSGATFARLGGRACEPVDDCTSPFPPPDALVVDGATAATDEERGALLRDALLRVPRGGTLAIGDGVYATGLEILKDVTIVGRCAGEVVLRSPSPRPTGREAPGAVLGNAGTKGIDVATRAKLGVRSITVEGFDYGLYADRGAIEVARVVFAGNRVGAAALFGAKLTMRDSLVSADPGWPRVDAAGVSAMMRDTEVTLEGVEVRGMDTGLSVASPATKLTVRRSVVHDDHAPAYRGMTLEVFRGATVRVEESAVTTRAGIALLAGRFLGRPPQEDAEAGAARVTIAASFLAHDGAPDSSPARRGTANVADGASVEFVGSTIHHASMGGASVQGGASLVARESVFTADATPAPVRHFLSVYDSGSRALLEDSALVGAQQTALRAHGAGVGVTLRRSLVTKTVQRGASTLEDVGATGQALGVGHGARLALDAAAIVDNEGLGVFVVDAELSAVNTLVDTTLAPGGSLGAGVLAVDGRVWLERSVIRRSADAAVAFEGTSSAFVSGSALVENAVGVRAAGASTLARSSGGPGELREGVISLHDTTLANNGVETSSAPITVR